MTNTETTNNDACFEATNIEIITRTEFKRDLTRTQFKNDLTDQKTVAWERRASESGRGPKV